MFKHLESRIGIHREEPQRPIKKIQDKDYDGILLAVPHKDIRLMGIEAIKGFGSDNCILFDLKSVFSSEDSDLRL